MKQGLGEEPRFWPGLACSRRWVALPRRAPVLPAWHRPRLPLDHFVRPSDGKGSFAQTSEQLTHTCYSPAACWWGRSSSSPQNQPRITLKRKGWAWFKIVCPVVCVKKQHQLEGISLSWKSGKTYLGLLNLLGISWIPEHKWSGAGGNPLFFFCSQLLSVWVNSAQQTSLSVCPASGSHITPRTTKLSWAMPRGVRIPADKFFARQILTSC